jgi:hypothetical protein
MDKIELESNASKIHHSLTATNSTCHLIRGKFRVLVKPELEYISTAFLAFPSLVTLVEIRSFPHLQALA